MQLVQDLEAIKNRFTELAFIMEKQEMAASLTRATKFVGEMA